MEYSNPDHEHLWLADASPKRYTANGNPTLLGSKLEKGTKQAELQKDDQTFALRSERQLEIDQSAST